MFKNQSERVTTRLRNCALIFLSLSLCASASAGDGSNHNSSISSLIPYWVNFLIFISLLYFGLKNKVAIAWNERRLAIKSEIEKSADENLKAQTELDKTQEKLKSISLELKRIQDSIEHQAKTEAQRIVDTAKQKALNLEQSMQEMLKAEALKVESELKHELVSAAVSEARKALIEAGNTNFSSPMQSKVLSVAKQLVEGSAGLVH